MTPDMLKEVIYREDIESEMEYTQEGWRNAYNFFLRAQAQGAPPELLQALSSICSSYQELHQKYGAIVPCFFPEPKW